MKKIIFYAFLLFPSCVFSQAYAPGFKTTLTINNDSSVVLNDYQILVVLNTALPIANGNMQSNGADIRFSADSCNAVSFYDYWIEDYINTDSTRIWVKIPQLNANTSSNFLVWYGDPSASSMSDFNATFPSAFISNGNDTTFTGTYVTDWFQLDSGDVVNLQPNLPLEINARVIIIDGTIQGRGLGFSAPLTMGNGNGPGGGTYSSDGGGGGGSYAGIGGTGGYDAGDSPGIGGPMYGFETDFSSYMGSSGGTTDNAIGGNGGGMILLNAEWIFINGHLDASGTQGIGSIGRCGGGGSGGTIFIMGNAINISVTGQLNSTGGDGGNGSSAANDGGGGGSGGRIKIFHGPTLTSLGSISLLGGNGGLYGSAAFGEDGEFGSFFDSTITFQLAYVAEMGMETSLKAEIVGLDSVYCLNKDSITLTAIPPGGSFAGPGVVANYFSPLIAGVGIHAITYLYTDPTGCGNLFDTAYVEVLNIPTFPTATNNGPVCEGASLNLSANDSIATHVWTGPNGFSSTSQFPIISGSTILNEGNYNVVITNTAGCTSSAQTNVTIYPLPTASASNNGPVCITEDLIFIATGGTNYSWTGPNGFNSAVQSPILSNTPFLAQGTYTVTITGIGGCMVSVTTEVQVDGCFDNVDNTDDIEIIIFPNPSHDQIWIEMGNTNINSESTAIIYNISGKEILHKIISSSNGRSTIDLTGIAPGTYTLIINDGQRSKPFKLIHN